MSNNCESPQEKDPGPRAGRDGAADPASAAAGEVAARFRAVFENSRDAIGVSRAGIHVFVNPAYRKLFGLPPDADLAGKPILDLIAPCSRDLIREYVSRRLRGEFVPPSYEIRGLRIDGSEFDMEVNVSTYQDNGAEHTLVILRDITERKRMEHALLTSERTLQAIIEAEPECVKVLDKNANLIMMNRAGLDMLQADSLDQVKGQCVCPLITSEYQPAFMDLTRRVFQGESGSLLFEMVGMKGRRVWLETHAVPLRTEKNEITALLAVTLDVTERKRSEQALRSSEARFRSIIEHAAAGILVADAVTRQILYANPEICRILGYSQQELLAIRATDLAVREEAEESAAAFKAHAEGKVHTTQRTFRRKDGPPVRMNINSVPMELDGRPVILGFFADITAQQLLEEERLKTQKLESLGTLAGGIAHDFNNLLQGIFGYISMAKLTYNEKEKSLAMLEEAEKALHRSVGLTTQLLTFSKGGKPHKEVISLRPVIEDAARFALSGSRAVFTLSIADDLLHVGADAGQIGQVIQNIVQNADQSMPLGGRIELSARNVPAASDDGLPGAAQGAMVAITVRDQGIGIPPEHLTRIFDPYFTTKERGSGLGLATSYSIVRNHGGSIIVSSELGKGSVFTIYLPAASAAQKPAVAGSARTSCLRGRILVMDDDAVVRDVAGALLGSLGHEVALAEHGEAAIEKFRKAREAGSPFDVVILDLTIRGGMGGAETVRKLLELDPDVKAVVSSGYSDDGAFADYHSQGFKAFMKKPYDIEELENTLHALLADAV